VIGVDKLPGHLGAVGELRYLDAQCTVGVPAARGVRLIHHRGRCGRGADVCDAHSGGSPASEGCPSRSQYQRAGHSDGVQGLGECFRLRFGVSRVQVVIPQTQQAGRAARSTP
jgi:hypothetical protein